MSKRPFLILSLLISVISLAYIILERQGVIREWKLKHRQPESYLNNYTKLPKADKDKVVVCFSTENNVPKQFLNSLLDQTVKVDEIILNTPYKSMNKLSPDLKKILSVHGYSKDYDTAVNLIYSVLSEPEADTKIILVDPSIIYTIDFVETMVDKSQKNPENIVYGNKNQDVKHGILIKPKFFDNKFCDYKKDKGCCTWINECSSVPAVYV